MQVRVHDLVMWHQIHQPDFVQEYSPAKRAEHAIKALRYDGSSVSVVDPGAYANRFTAFLRQKVFQ